MLVVFSAVLPRPLPPTSCEVKATPTVPVLAPAVLLVRVTLRAELLLPAARPFTLPEVPTPLPLVKLAARFSTYPAGPLAVLETRRFVVAKMPPAWMLPRLMFVEATAPAA